MNKQKTVVSTHTQVEKPSIISAKKQSVVSPRKV